MVFSCQCKKKINLDTLKTNKVMYVHILLNFKVWLFLLMILIEHHLFSQTYSKHSMPFVET